MAAARPASHPLIPAAAAVALSGGIAIAVTVLGRAAGEDGRLVIATALVGSLGVAATLVAVAVRRALLVGWGVALLAAGYAITVMTGPARVDASAPLIGLGLLLGAELAYTACEWRGPHAADVVVEQRRWVRVVVVSGAGALIGAGVLALSSALPGSVPGLLAGAAAAVALIALVTWLRRGGGDGGTG